MDGRRGDGNGGRAAQLALLLSATALLVSLVAASGLGDAAASAFERVVPIALFARNAGALDGHRASLRPRAGQIPVLDARGKLPDSVGAVGPPGRDGARGADGAPGPAGALDLTKVSTVRSPLVTLHPHYATPITVPCPSGAIAIGGGFDAGLQPEGVRLVTALVRRWANGRSVWVVRIFNERDDDAHARAQAICLAP